jgi:hypothetical protein
LRIISRRREGKKMNAKEWYANLPAGVQQNYEHAANQYFERLKAKPTRADREAKVLQLVAGVMRGGVPEDIPEGAQRKSRRRR